MPIHDPCAVLYCLHPELFQTKEFRARIDCSGAHNDVFSTAGQVVLDIRTQESLPGGRGFGEQKNVRNLKVALQMDVPAFFRHMHNAVKFCGERWKGRDRDLMV